MILAATVTRGNVPDIKRYKLLLKKVNRDFQVKMICGDKGYSSREVHEYTQSLNITPIIDFKKNATGKAKGSPAWNKSFKFYKEEPKEFEDLYAKRPNVESTFSGIKRKFLSHTRAKKIKAQEN